MIKLTDEQQQIVNHEEGNALVLAVAGSGKTTAMVYRIKNLVENKNVKPDKILSCAYNRDAVEKIKEELSNLNISKVNVKTIHGLAYDIFKDARSKNMFSQTITHNEEMNRVLIKNTFKKLTEEYNCYKGDFLFDEKDLIENISLWKSNLAFPEGMNLGIPEEYNEYIKKAEDEDSKLLRAYKIYEELRINEDVIMYDDQLVYGWKALIMNDDFRETWKAKYKYVMVDEYQDVNNVQMLIIDLLTHNKNNLMVIGDDDQCIYQWRGANPDFILNFEKKNNAKIYYSQNNFRCTAQQVVLANEIIKKNGNRYQKSLQLTKGFDGETIIEEFSSSTQIAQKVYDEIRTLLENGVSTENIMILVRRYSQTAIIESVFINNNLPYQIVDKTPFYKRKEIIPFIRYFRFIEFEKILAKTKDYFENRSIIDDYFDCFTEIINKPKRYIKKPTIEGILRESLSNNQIISNVITYKQQDFTENEKRYFREFLNILLPFKQNNYQMQEAIKLLESLLNYKNYIKSLSPYPELGEIDAENIDALFLLAENKGTIREFLQYLKKISFNREEEKADSKWLKIMSVHKAKGLDWDYVFLPNAEDFYVKTGATKAETEEERRLLYVAITRTKKKLYIYKVNNRRSIFFEETDFFKINKNVDDLSRKIDDIESLTVESTAETIKLLNVLDLNHFANNWWGKKEHFLAKASSMYDLLTEHINTATHLFNNYEKELQQYEKQLKLIESKSNSKNKKIEKLKYNNSVLRTYNFNIENSSVLNKKDPIITLQKGVNKELFVYFDKIKAGKIHPKDSLIKMIISDNLEKLRGKITSQLNGQIIFYFEIAEKIKTNDVNNLKEPEKPSGKFEIFLDNVFQNGLKNLIEKKYFN